MIREISNADVSADRIDLDGFSALVTVGENHPFFPALIVPQLAHGTHLGPHEFEFGSIHVSFQYLPALYPGSLTISGFTDHRPETPSS